MPFQRALFCQSKRICSAVGSVVFMAVLER
jgi:hypothetical protein